MPLLTKKLSKINFSLQYDTITLYPTQITQAINTELLMFVTACGKLGYILPGDAIESDVLQDSKCVPSLEQFQNFNRFIHRDDPDHNLYHQDEFKLEDQHYHIKCKSMLNHDKLKAILTIGIEHGIVTATEVAAILADFNKKYKTDLQKTVQSLVESKDQARASRAIHAFIKTCTDLDTLVFLHERLVLPEYAFLRKVQVGEKQKPSSSIFFRAVVSSEGATDKTSKAWAEIEESIELQMTHIVDASCRLNPKLGEEFATELRSDAPFFGMQHKCNAATKPTDESVIMKLLKKGDALGLEEEYVRHFRACG